MLSIAFAGFLAGLIHVLSGPDHLAAVAPYALIQGKRAWLVGLRWGVGHTSGVVVVGLFALLVRGLLPVEKLSAWSESLVGFVLIAIGLWGLRTALKNRLHVHAHEHENGGERHVHIHAHAPGIPHDSPQAHRHSHAAFGVGLLHGLAGTSHVLGVLPAVALPSTAASVAYLAVFGIGSILGMVGFAALIGLATLSRFARSAAAHTVLLCACSVTAIGVGGLWLVNAFGGGGG